MKKMTLILVAFCICSFIKAQFNVGGIIKDKAKQKAQDKIEKGVDKGLDETEKGAKDAAKKKEKDKNSSDKKSGSEDDVQENSNASSSSSPSSHPLKVYANYDFKPGEKIIFEDDFRSDMDGEFPAHWELETGQAVINKINGIPAFFITEGNYGIVSPRIKTEKYLPAEFTIEFDHYIDSKLGSYGIELKLIDANGEVISLSFNDNNISVYCSKTLEGTLPDNLIGNNYYDKWNHIAIAFKNKQIKAYCNQTRVVVFPNCEFNPVAVKFAGAASPETPIIFTNVKIAEGGSMNMLQKITTDGRLIIHGIKFDYNKATIKPESMGVLNDLAKMLKENASLKFNIEGHTDSDGDDAGNLKLSQARADAVKNQLVSMGIAADRLTTKGLGETKPIADNNSPEGKANNRRVEFVKM